MSDEESDFGENNDEEIGEESSEPDFGGDDEKDMNSKPMLHKETNECKSCGKAMEQNACSHCETNEAKTEEPVEASSTQLTKEAEAKNLENLLFNMKKGTLKTTKDATNSLFDGLFAQALMQKEAKASGDVKKMEYKAGNEGDKLKVTPAQDSTEVKFKDGGKIGHEEKFSADNPNVPRAAATIGDEDSSNTVNDTGDVPTVPHGSPAMAGEKAYRPERGNVADGNQSAQTTSSNKSTTKTAGCKKCDSDECGCGKGFCGTHCFTCKGANSEQTTKTAGCKKCDNDECGCGKGFCGTHCFTCKGAGSTKSTKVAGCGCGDDCGCGGNCGDDCGCGCSGGKPCSASNKKAVKTASTNNGDKSMKTANVWTVPQGHQHYDALTKKAEAGQTEVKLQDGQTYNLVKNQNSEFVLIAQTTKVKHVKTYEDDPDINQSSGAGKGKVKADETHSLGVDEKKPSDGMSEPSIPEAENGGQLKREHTYDNKLEMPEIPAGGGSNPEYDNVEKYKPEKQDELLGKENEIMASVSQDEAWKVANRLVKANLITFDDMQAKVNELSRGTPELLKSYEEALKIASTKKGMQKTASGVESALPNTSESSPEGQEPEFKDVLQSLFRLDKRNLDHERYTQDRGNAGLYR